MNDEDTKFVQEFDVMIESPPIKNKESADVFLIRHGFSEFNAKH